MISDERIENLLFDYFINKGHSLPFQSENDFYGSLRILIALEFCWKYNFKFYVEKYGNDIGEYTSGNADIRFSNKNYKMKKDTKKFDLVAQWFIQRNKDNDFLNEIYTLLYI